LYGSILEMSISEIKSKLSSIAEFSELGSALNNPLRTYSSGMAARLGFSVIVNTDANILLIDEVLAVGDAKFKKKCEKFLLNFKTNGGTLIIVSHEIDVVSKICDSGIILDLGRLYFKGDIQVVLKKYTELFSKQESSVY
jgi:ABC-type polysaccharide/polyol phosphate transport system ATPase subunit